MGRGDQQEQVFQVTEPFAVCRAGAPEVYGPDRMVMSTDPILRTHRANFAPVSSRIQDPARLVAAPRTTPPPPVAEGPTEAEEATAHG